jgi:hypothetical protein
MVRDSLLTLAPWPLGPLAPWPLNPLAPWPLGPRFFPGATVWAWQFFGLPGTPPYTTLGHTEEHQLSSEQLWYTDTGKLAKQKLFQSHIAIPNDIAWHSQIPFEIWLNSRRRQRQSRTETPQLRWTDLAGVTQEAKFPDLQCQLPSRNLTW